MKGMQDLNSELVDIVNKPVDIKRLIRKLAFDINDLESAAEKQPGLRLEAGRFKAQIGLKAATAKRKLSRIVGKKSIRIRKYADKTTEGAVKNELSQDDEVMKYQERFDTLEIYSQLAHDLNEAFKERSMAISILTRLRASEVSSHLASVKGAEEVDNLSKKARHIRGRYTELED